MSWFRRRTRTASARGSGPQQAADAGEVVPGAVAFVCSACGRTDLPPAGDWDPPICSECDAAINFDAIEEADYLHDR